MYNGQPLVVGTGKSARTVMLVSTPVTYSGRFLGMIASVIDLDFLIRRLKEIDRGGLTPYVVDSQGRLVAGARPEYATGQDMSFNELVKGFRYESSNAQISVTKEFQLQQGKNKVAMLGTYDPVPGLGWAQRLSRWFS